MPLTKAQLKDKCLLHSGWKTCRYVSVDDLDWTKFHCLKLSSQKKNTDAEVEKHILKCKNLNMDVKRQNRAIGDNCKGYPLLQIIDQGYDLDKP